MTPSSSTTGLNGCSLTTTTSPPWSEHRLRPTALSALRSCHFKLEKVSDVLIRDMLKYTASVREWMTAHPENIIAIHCKGGKGEVKESRFVFFFYYYVLIAVTTCVLSIKGVREP